MDLSKRKLGIGGSDVAAILNIRGVNTFSTAVEIWEDKISPEVREIILRPDDHTSNLYWGKVFEDAIIGAYKLTAENDDITYGKTLKQFHHKKHPWLIANIDGIARTKEQGPIILEVKYWENDPNEQWGESGTDKIPMGYMCQVQHYMHVLDMPAADVAVKVRGDFRTYNIPRSESIIEAMQPKLEKFWFENVQKKIPPEPSNLKDVRIVYKKSNSGEKEATEDQIKTVEEMRLLKLEILELKEQLDTKKLGIAEYMGEYGKLVAGNERLVTFNSNKNGTRIFKVL